MSAERVDYKCYGSHERNESGLVLSERFRLEKASPKVEVWPLRVSVIDDDAI